MDSLGARRRETIDHLERVFRVNSRVVVVALRQAHAAAAEDVDGRDD